VHEQDNVKMRLDPSRELLVREAGLNRYTRVEKELTAGETYWKETEPYWREVRAAWDRRLAAPAVEIESWRDGTVRYEHFLERAEEFREAKRPGDSAERRGEIESALAVFVRPKAAGARASAGR
jgi:predicted acyl esterase